MEINISRFGVQESSPEKTLYFPKGIPGFEGNKYYQIFHEETPDHVVYYLQSLDNPDLTLHTILSEQFGMKYDYRLSEDELALLDARESQDLLSLCVISKTKDEDQISVYMDCPILINPSSKRGVQILAGGDVMVDMDEKQSRVCKAA